MLRNNCAHIAHNALAAVGLWDEWPTDRFILFAAFDFPVPKNEFVNLMRRTNDMPIDDPEALYERWGGPRGPAAARAGSRPMPGALVEQSRRSAQRTLQYRSATDLLRRADLRPLPGSGFDRILPNRATPICGPTSPISRRSMPGSHGTAARSPQCSPDQAFATVITPIFAPRRRELRRASTDAYCDTIAA